MAIVWLALAYNLPANPSRNRVYVWRKLKEMGAEYFRQGMSILPSTGENVELFRKLSQKVRAMGGESHLVELRFLEGEDEEEMVEKFRAQARQEYVRLIEEAQSLAGTAPQPDGKIRRLLRQVEKIRVRTGLLEGITGEMEEGLQQLLETFKGVAGDFGSQLRGTLDENRRKKGEE